MFCANKYTEKLSHLTQNSVWGGKGTGGVVNFQSQHFYHSCYSKFGRNKLCNTSFINKEGKHPCQVALVNTRDPSIHTHSGMHCTSRNWKKNSIEILNIHTMFYFKNIVYSRDPRIWFARSTLLQSLAPTRIKFTYLWLSNDPEDTD